ncbi:MAG: isochorismatase family protein [Acidobacteria bacterium]|nr:isochorismatase family protein [Acidobacteriota bacterium]
MASISMLESRKTGLVVIDMQEKFRPIIRGFDELAEKVGIMVQGCNFLQIPILVTEQYPQGLGETAKEISQYLPSGTKPLEKKTFSACGVSEFDLQLRERHIEQILITGIEAHICVSQTVHDLLKLGYQVHLICDAIGARFEQNQALAFKRLKQAGAIISSVEMSLFELLKTSDNPMFKTIQRLIT